MNLKKLLALSVCLLPLGLVAVPKITNPSVKSATTFAIFVDSKSYEQAADEVNAYRAALEKEGLGSYILVDDWASPDAIRSEIVKMMGAAVPLEGVVFVGDIPVPMLRDAQHMSSAFKMDQKRDWRDSSIPSDRFYDDVDLKFDFIKQDDEKPLYFYYSLAADSPQHIATDIYSGRILPPHREGVDRYELLRSYLRKVVEAHGESNELDNMFMFRGHGYNSEAKDAWSGEQVSLREQLPNVFKGNNIVRFYDFETRWPMKPYLLEKITQPNVDVALCHHHGSPDMQLLNGYRNVSGIDYSITNIKLYLRSKLEGRDDYEERKADFMKRYGVPAEWCVVNDSLRIADSLLNYRMDMYVADLHDVAVNPRFVMFDACYNGSFHEDDCIANSYIFNSGKTIVTQGNTVNALQDKWPDRYIGLFDCGVRIGEWNRYVCYLETHIVGDPTYRFANRALSGVDLNTTLTTKNGDNKYWLKLLSSSDAADVQAIALRKLSDNGYKDINDLLVKYFTTSQYGSVRLEALTLMSTKQAPEFLDMLASASTDNYELIRRMSAIYMAECGNDELLPSFVGLITDNDLSVRVSFQASNRIMYFNSTKAMAEVEKQFTSKPYIYEGEKTMQYMLKRLGGEEAEQAEAFKYIRDDSNKISRRKSEITTFRNARRHDCVPALIALAEDTSLEQELRVAAIEALGWFNRSYKVADIDAMCHRLIADQAPEISAEALKTHNRIKAY
jgi:hypothetical protein